MPHLIRQLSLPFAAFLFATCLPAQGPLGTITGTVPQGQLGTCLREVGDVDGDGVRDFAASEPGSNSNTAGAVRLYSGATRNLLQTFQGVLATGMWGLGSKDVCVVGDVNGDGTTDFAAGYVNRGLLDVFSGATGARLYRMGPTLEYFQYACCVGDRDADGRDDFAALVYVNSTVQLWTIKGNTGTQLSVIDAQPQEGLLRAVGDLDGDGSDEFVRVGYGTCDVYRMNPPARLRRITLGSNAGDIGFADWNGDGRQDLVVQYDVNQQPCVQVFNLFTGAQLRSYTLTGVLANSTPQGMAVLGDCDQDGTPDFALRVSADPINAGTAHVAIFSGASGLRIGDWPGSPQFPATGILQGLGDVNGDAFPDFVMASPSYQSGGGLQVVSARTFAT
ncbi:MAG: VCBS repeat-containing protein, partial [Planctomycetes bacterium]|nr:VCBS repeat-containing protein [Planctomycetota bacterium]